MPYPKPLAERFWPRVRKTEACWIWEGARTTSGYGVIGRGKRGEGTIPTHRLAWEFTYGPVPAGHYLLHSCDNPPCCNPDHLRLGTAAENVQDWLVRGKGRVTPRQAIAPVSSAVSIEEKLWPRVQKTETCWLWQGPKLKKFGHGYLTRGGRGTPKVLVHRLSWELANGPIPDKQYVLHRCDIPACVRPDHLFLGTKADNSLDMVQKGRNRKGESHQTARLTEEQVREIRQRFDSRTVVNKRVGRDGPDSASAIARDYGVSHATVLGILHNRIWTKPRPPRNKERLTFVDAEAIRHRFAARTTSEDPNSITSLAREFGVGVETVHDLVNRKTWKHID